MGILSLSLSLCLSIYLSLYLSISLSPSVSLSLSHSLSLSLSHIHSLSHSLTHSLTCTHLHTHIYAHCLYNSYNVIGYVIHRIDKSTWSCIEFYSGVLTLEMMVFITCVLHVLLAQSRLPPSKGSVFAHGHEKRAQGQEGRPLTCRVLQRD